MRKSLLAVLLAGVACSSPLTAQTPTTSKTIARTKDDLPRYSYKLPGTAIEMLNADDTAFLAFAAPVALDIDKTLARFDIADRAAIRQLLSTRLSYEVLANRNEAGLATIAQIRELEEKPSRRLTSNLRTEAILKARIAAGAVSGPAYHQAYERIYKTALSALPWTVVGNDIKEVKSATQVLTADLAEGVVRSDIEPAVKRDGGLSNRLSDDFLWARMARAVELPLRDQSLAALNAYIAANNVAKPEIWSVRAVRLTERDRLTPVTVAIWDSGVDLSLFPGRVYRDPASRLVAPFTGHGTAFDVEARPSRDVLYPLTPEQRQQYRAAVTDFQGMADLQEAIDSPAADAFKAKVAALPSDKVPQFFETTKLYGNYLHGTHVAGIVADGNPAIRLAVARITSDHRNVRIPPTDELTR